MQTLDTTQDAIGRWFAKWLFAYEPFTFRTRDGRFHVAVLVLKKRIEIDPYHPNKTIFELPGGLFLLVYIGEQKAPVRWSKQDLHPEEMRALSDTWTEEELASSNGYELKSDLIISSESLQDRFGDVIDYQSFELARKAIEHVTNQAFRTFGEQRFAPGALRRA